MDENESAAAPGRQAGPAGDEGTSSTTARAMRADAEKAMREIKRDVSIGELFNFEKMHFPFFAKVVFIIYSLLVLLIGLYMAVISFLYILYYDVLWDGLVRLAVTIIFVSVAFVFGRVAIEAVMVVFKINEAVQDIREMLRAKMK